MRIGIRTRDSSTQPPAIKRAIQTLRPFTIGSVVLLSTCLLLFLMVKIATRFSSFLPHISSDWIGTFVLLSLTVAYMSGVLGGDFFTDLIWPDRPPKRTKSLSKAEPLISGAGSERNSEQTKNFWNRVAYDWRRQVGKRGDSNRFLNSDPVLWAFAGDVTGLAVLDAGCGTGYLSKQLHDRGANVIGIDFSERMIAIARADYPGIDFRVDSCSTLHTIPDKSFDLIIANYVLMDTPDLNAAMTAFYRVLRQSGVSIVVFSHPCFPQGAAITSTTAAVHYYWRFPYFQQMKCIDPPWAHFTSEFIWFHRPLSDYWKAFTAAGFQILDFEEPRITEDRYHLAENPRKLENSKNRPYSVAFKLRKA